MKICNQKIKLKVEKEIDKKEFNCQLKSSIRLFQKEKEKRGRANNSNENVSIIEEVENLIVIGDIHGDLDTLLKILFSIKYEHFLSNPKNKMVFLGDYIDRGDFPLSVLNILFRLKQKYSDAIILLRGNHEAAKQFPFGSHDLLEKLEPIYKSDSLSTYDKLMNIFEKLPIIAIIKEEICISHGGFPININTNIQKNQFFKYLKKNEIVEQFLWNDPRDINTKSNWEKSRRHRGFHFGETITKYWLDILKVKVLIRGHEPCKGFKVDHNGKVITIFSSKNPYPKFEAGYLLINKKHIHKMNNAYELSKFVRLVKD